MGKTDLVNPVQENNVLFLFYNKEPTPETIQSTVIDTKSIFIGTSPREAGDTQGEILAELYAKDKSIDKNGDGVLVMSNGRLSGIIKRGIDFGGIEGEQETILRLAAKYV
jgi:hypothetical protein